MNLTEVISKILDMDFDTYVIGIKSKNLDQEEKKKILKELRKRIWFKNKKVDFNNPEIVILYDYDKNKFEIKTNPVIIKGIYKKFVRNLPQTPWKKYGYKDSVAEIICKEFKEFGKPVFHGAGREDVDVLNLGGRPFFIEIKNPKKKKYDLKEIQKKINKDLRIKVYNLKYSNRKEMKDILTKKFKKEYRVLVYSEQKLPENIKYLEDYFRNKIIYQRTPTRVSHRRSDKIRVKKVYKTKVKIIDDHCFECYILGDHGLYIKELVHGDNSRTFPNFSSYLNRKLKVVELDVVGFGDMNGRNT